MRRSTTRGAAAKNAAEWILWVCDDDFPTVLCVGPRHLLRGVASSGAMARVDRHAESALLERLDWSWCG